jgi:hypothetical protein
MSDAASTEKTRPFDEFADGALKVTLWQKPGEHGPWYQATLRRRYKDKNGEWKDADSYGEDDLLSLAELLREAHARIRQQKRADTKARREAQPAAA